ncbi:MAG: HAD family hydrolase [Dehalococcoidia bacterium]|nr:HAD family hydrolase [Dehalococcoidia bacterium]
MRAPAPITTVLFDLDDTLLHTFPLRVVALQQAFDAAGIADPTAASFITTMTGRQLNDTLAELTLRLNVAYDVTGHYRRAYWLLEGGRSLFAGVQHLVERLHDRGVRMGVVTQKERRFEIGGRVAGVHRELEDMGLAPYIGVTIGFEDVTQHKPHPEPVHAAMRALGATPGETLFVGDSAADIQAALAAGVRACHAAWGLPPGHAGLDGATPHHTAHAPDDVLRLVTGP